jgi:endonuclease/exonuclease/phosphatase family metal-dependent hydrolase
MPTLLIKKIILYLLTGAALAAASCSPAAKKTDPAPITQPGPETETGQPLRVMTYNIHHANPPSRPDFIDLDAIVNTIQAQQPDLVALQEVDVHTTRSGPYNQAEEIARKLNMSFYFAKAIDYQGGSYGVAILSKWPLSEASLHPLPSKAGSNAEARVLATAKVQLPDGSFIRFGSTHLDAQTDPANRQLQVDEIGRLAAGEKLPFVIAGDFNATPETAVVATLDKHFRRSCQVCGPTIPVSNPSRTIDYIAYAPGAKFSVATHQVVNERYASDHLPVVALLRLRP